MLPDNGFSLQVWASKKLEFLRDYKGGKWFRSGDGVTRDLAHHQAPCSLEDEKKEKATTEGAAREIVS